MHSLRRCIKWAVPCNVLMAQRSLCDSEQPPTQSSSIMFLGTGSSIGTPFALHLMQDTPFPSKQVSQATSRKAAVGNPVNNKNYRCNPSLLVSYCNNNRTTNIVFDAGKTFREAILRWFPRHGVASVDAVVLTHGHADAIFGLDDIRSVQRPDLPAMPVYLSPECYSVVQKVFFYMFPASTPGAVQRHVSNIDWKVVHHMETFHVSGLAITPIPVMHGEDLISNGYLIGNRKKVLYLSDISRMPEASLSTIKQYDIDILIVDALCMTFKHPTHFNLDQAIALCKEIKPGRCLLVGMSSEMEHEAVNAYLKELEDVDCDIRLAHDGLKIDIDL